MNYFDGIEVGDRVWDFTYGWGIVANVDCTNEYPIQVIRENVCQDYYTLDGKPLVNHNQTLFWDEVKFEVPSKPLPKLVVDTKILVRNNLSDEWVNRYFSHWEPSGRIACFNSGTTSWTADTNPSTRTSLWKYWKLSEDSKMNLDMTYCYSELCKRADNCKRAVRHHSKHITPGTQIPAMNGDECIVNWFVHFIELKPNKSSGGG